MVEESSLIEQIRYVRDKKTEMKQR